MSPNPPEVASLVLDIPDDCRMRGEFTDVQQLTGERDIRVVFGNSGDAIQLRFERPALVRLVQLSVNLLALGPGDDAEGS
ncbi:hypothetical protein [Actinophytocola sediminis]